MWSIKALKVVQNEVTRVSCEMKFENLVRYQIVFLIENIEKIQV